jgi:hypothetical protein
MRLNLNFLYALLLLGAALWTFHAPMAQAQTDGIATGEFVGTWNVTGVFVSPALPETELDPWNYMLVKGWQVEFTADGKVRFANESGFPHARYRLQNQEITLIWPSVEAVSEPGRASGPAESSTLYTFRWEGAQLVLLQDQGRFQRTIRLVRG